MGLDPYQKYRGDVVDNLIEGNVVGDKGEFKFFGGGEGRFRASSGTEIEGIDEDLVNVGNMLSILTSGEIDSGLAGMFANALDGAESLNASMLTAQSLLLSMGVDAETAGRSLLDAYLNGNIALDELNATLNAVNMTMINDLPSLEDGFKLFADSIDDPRSAITALGLTFQELEQEGITSSEGIIAAFTDRFGPEIGEAIRGIVEAGLTSFEALSNASVPQLQLLVNELDGVNKVISSTGNEGERVGEGIERGSEKAGRAIAKQADEWDKLRKRINEADDAKRRYFADNRTPEFGTAPNGG